MPRWALTLFAVALLVGVVALPVGAGSSELLSADFLYTDNPDDPDEPNQHLVVLIDEASGVSEFSWNAEIGGEEIDGAWIEGEIGCVSFLGKAAVVGVQYVDIGSLLPGELLDSWWLIEFIDGGPGMGGDLLVSMESSEAGVFEACAAAEHLDHDVDGVWVNDLIGGNIYVAATASSQVETINVNYQIPRDTDLVLDPGMLDWGCDGGYYQLESGYLKVKMQTKDQGDTIRIRQSADMDGVLQRYDVSEVCDESGCWNEYTPTGEFFDLDQNKHRVDLLVDQYTGNPISGTIYAWTDIFDDLGNVVDFAHIDGEFVDGVFDGVWDDTCGF